MASRENVDGSTEIYGYQPQEHRDAQGAHDEPTASALVSWIQGTKKGRPNHGHQLDDKRHVSRLDQR